MLQPVKRVAHQKIAHFGAAEVVDQRVPVLVKTFARIGVLVKCRAVKASQSMCIRGKVRRHPVQNDAQPGRVSSIDKVPEVLWRAKARCRGIQAHRLVAPRAVKGVLADRHQLQMREAHIPGVGHQGGSQFAVAQPTPAIGLTPGPQMHLIDADRLIEVVCLCPLRPHGTNRRQALHDACGAGPQLRAKGKGIGLEKQLTRLCPDFKFVEFAHAEARYKQLPDAALVP